MNVFLFPYALLRVSGEYFKKIESLNFNETIFILNKRSEQLKNKELLKTQICDELYDLIPAIRENETQNLLLNLKRNIYNNRSSKEELLVKVNSHLNDNIKALLVKYEKIEKEIIIILNLYQKTFLKEFNNIQEKLFEISKSEVLKRGIILSSSSLHQQLISFLKKEFKDITNEDRKIENSLIKFITRLCTKTSPFSTFTNLAICEVKSFKYLLKESNFISINHSKKKIVHSHVKLNNTILKYILNIIFLDERIYEKIDIDLNPSLELKQNKYNYLTTTNKVDSFQSITQNEVLDVFVKLLKKEKGSISFIKLCNKIFEKEIIQASVDEIKEFVKQLIDIGFIEWRFGVSGQDPDWDINLTEKLKSLEIDLPELLDLIKSIRTLRLLSKKYEKASSNKRNLILIHSFKLLKESCENLKKKSLKVYNDKDSKTLSEDDNDFPFKPEGIFYEDTTLKIQPKINKEYLEDISYKLSLLYKELGLFEVRLKEKTKMMAYYIEKYGKHERVNLLTFYEEYYRDVKIHEQENIKEGVQKVKMTETNVFYERSVEVSIDLDKKRQLWLDMFADVINYKSISKQGSTNFTLSDFVKTNEKVLTPTNNTVSSHAAFLQFFEDNSSKDDFFAILNVSVSGFGKYFSRFLPLFNDTITKKTVVINKDHPKNIIRAENCDDSYFNANIHPPLMPYEMWIPGSQNMRPPHKQVSVIGVQLYVDEEENELKLFDKKSKKQVQVFDLGFQGIKGRSNLYQLLEKFTPIQNYNVSEILNRINKVFQKDTNNYTYEIKPRIIYERNIIIQRKSWILTKDSLPFRNTIDSKEDYFAKVLSWKEKLNLPDEVFVYIIERSELRNLNKNENLILKHDDHKPQYISFHNPILIDLFSKIIKRVPNNLLIEEMLPSSNQLMKINKKEYVSEILYQWHERI